MVNLTPEQLKKLKQLARIEKNPTLEIVNEISSVKNVLKKTKETNTALLEQINNLSTIDIDDIKNDIIGSIDRIRLIIEQYAINSKKDAQKEVNNQEKDRKLDEIKNSITEAIQRLAESIPEINDYNDQLNQILIELSNDEKAENIIKKLDELRTSILEKDFPKNLTEDDQVKVKLSEEQIKKILKGLNVQVVNASSEYAVDISGNRINRATVEKQDEIKQAIEAISFDTTELATEETIQSIAGLNIPKHDTKELVYTDGVLTSIVYKLAGATVATETLIYTDGIFTGVTIL